MPVKKFRRIEAPPEAGPTGGDGVRAALDLSALCYWLRPWATPRGVFRDTSIEQAQERRRGGGLPAAEQAELRAADDV